MKKILMALLIGTAFSAPLVPASGQVEGAKKAINESKVKVTPIKLPDVPKIDTKQFSADSITHPSEKLKAQTSLIKNGLVNANERLKEIEAKQAELEKLNTEDAGYKWLCNYFDLVSIPVKPGVTNLQTYDKLVRKAVENYWDLELPMPSDLVADINRYHKENPLMKYAKGFYPYPDSYLLRFCVSMFCRQASNDLIPTEEAESILSLGRYAKKYKLPVSHDVVKGLYYYVTGNYDNAQGYLMDNLVNYSRITEDMSDEEVERLMEKMPEVVAGLDLCPTEIIIVDENGNPINSVSEDED